MIGKDVSKLSPVDGRITGEDAEAILGSIADGLCVAASDGQVLWANDRFTALDEQTKARIAATCRRDAQREPGPGAEASRSYIASPDESRWYEVIVTPVQRTAAEGGALVCALVRDITAMRRREQKISAIDRAGSELVRLDAESIRKLHVGERLKVLEEKIVRFSHDLLHFDHLAIRLLDERSGKLELVVASGLTPAAREAELFARREGNGIMGFVAATGESYVCNDVLTDPRYVEGIPNARSSLTVPLRLCDKVIGAFNVESDRPNAFSDEDRQFAEMFATHIALALHILDLLVVERCEAGASVTGTVEGELSEPLTDIVKETEWLRSAATAHPDLREHVDRIVSDVDAIRRRVREAAQGPQYILGADRAMLDLTVDPALAGKRVLVADDEAGIRQSIRQILRIRGCKVTSCESGARAIQELERSARGTPFDLLISDIRMPDKSGYEVFSEARRISPGIPAILMTGFGYDPHHSIVRASEDGLGCVLFKPFQAERLLEEVRKALGVSPRTEPA